LYYIDEYKIGKINQFEGMDKNITWDVFLQKAVDILRAHNKPFYVKQDLREQAPDVKLSQKEMDMDVLTLQPKIQQLSLSGI